VNRRKLLEKLLQGHVQNISFKDFHNLVLGFGFSLDRIAGSHHLFTREDIPDIVNLQEQRGEAKPYQVREFVRLIERYNLRLEDES
jgi:predicted RNA binding protein YcfA (HicA-like mRNA interferase family)